MEKYLNIFNYAPFLMWNDNEDLSEDKFKILNKMDINNNVVKKNKNDNIELMKDVFFSLDNTSFSFLKEFKYFIPTD